MGCFWPEQTISFQPDTNIIVQVTHGHLIGHHITTEKTYPNMPLLKLCLLIDEAETTILLVPEIPYMKKRTLAWWSMITLGLICKLQCCDVCKMCWPNIIMSTLLCLSLWIQYLLLGSLPQTMRKRCQEINVGYLNRIIMIIFIMTSSQSKYITHSRRLQLLRYSS